LKGQNISFYHSGNFTDLCSGPHIPSAGKIKAVKLLSIAGAYWRGSEKNKMLTRIYGVTFPTQKELDEHLLRLEEAKRRDHRKLGQELELFLLTPKVGGGLPLWLPKGTIIRETLEGFLREEQRKRVTSRSLHRTSATWTSTGPAGITRTTKTASSRRSR